MNSLYPNKTNEYTTERNEKTLKSDRKLHVSCNKLIYSNEPHDMTKREERTNNDTSAGCVSLTCNKNIWIALSHYCVFYKAIYLELGVNPK